MTVPTVALDETKPAGSRSIKLGDNDIREFKTQVREVMDIDHKFDSSGQDADMGKHDQVSLLEKADIGTGAEGKPILGAQTINGKAELVFTDEDDNDIQVTSAGKVKLASGRLENNVNLTARNAAGSGDVNLLKANASDQAEITPALLPAGGVILPEISAPTTAANQGGLYTKNDGDQTELYFREESNGDEVQITNGGGLVLSGSVVIGAGTAAHGATIAYPSLMSGKSSTDYTWYLTLSVNDFDTSGSNGAINKIDVRDSSRVVTCTVNRFNWVNGATNTTVNGTANYIIIGILN